VALDRGSVRAEVTPRHRSEGMVETFAVEVENTRVAVHGTAFSVTRAGESVIVDVEHGSVAVGPAGNVGVSPGHLLVGPKRASFSLDGGRSEHSLPGVAAEAPKLASAAPEKAVDGVVTPTEGASRDAPPAQAVHPAAPAHLAPPKSALASPPPPAAPAPPPATLTVASVRARLAQCFEKTDEGGSSSVEVSVSSTLRLVLKSDGSVQSARFDPPLKPEFQLCAGSAIAGRFAEGGGTLEIPIVMKR
jgi:hypothetical protein